MTDQEAAKAAEPGKRAFDDPAAAIPPEASVIFIPPMHTVGPVGDDQGNAAGGEPFARRVAVIRHVADQRGQARRGPSAASPRDADRLQRRVEERDFARAGRGDMYSQRNTLAVDHHHALRTLAPLGFSDVSAPFFADMNEPSMNVVSQSSRPRASSWPRNPRHSASHVPSSSHRRRRRQQVAPLGYPSGRSRHRAPVLSTQRIPSTTARLLMRGRPPFGERRGRGRCGSILAHCASVTRTLRLGTSTSAQGGTAAIENVQVLIAPVTGF